MPTGIVNCRYVGGPWDGRTEELAAIYCRDSIGVALGTWISEQPDGSVAIMKGERGPTWTAYAYALYEKDPRRSDDGGATYRYVRTIDVQRCAKVLEGKGRRCKNSALEGKELCRDHEKMRVRQAADKLRRSRR
jgi:hypothetical protein